MNVYIIAGIIISAIAISSLIICIAMIYVVKQMDRQIDELYSEIDEIKRYL